PGRAAGGQRSGFGDGDFSNMPDLDLAVADFSLSGRPLGALKLVGSRDRGAQRWLLRTLQLRNDAAVLDASGVWQLAGRGRGLAADVQVDIADLGRLFARLGLPG